MVRRRESVEECESMFGAMSSGRDEVTDETAEIAMTGSRIVRTLFSRQLGTSFTEWISDVQLSLSNCKSISAPKWHELTVL